MAMTDKTLAEVLQARVDELEKRLAGHDQLFALANKTLDEKDVRIIQLEALTSEGARYNDIIRTLVEKLVAIDRVDSAHSEFWYEMDCACGYTTSGGESLMEDVAWEHVAEEHFANLGPNLAQARDDRDKRMSLELEREGWDGAARIAELEKELRFLRMTERMAHQHAVRADATVAELEAQLAQREADLAHMKAQRWGATAETVDRMVKAENRLDVLEARRMLALVRCRQADDPKTCQFAAWDLARDIIGYLADDREALSDQPA